MFPPHHAPAQVPMKHFGMLLAGGLVASAVIVHSPAPAVAQTMVCTTTTKTVTYYFSDGSYAVHTESVRLCQPI